MLKSLLTQKSAEHATGALVLISAGLAGHQAALGMSQPQLMGAATAILGSVMAAVMVRLWPQGDSSDGDRPDGGRRIPIRIRIRKDD